MIELCQFKTKLKTVTSQLQRMTRINILSLLSKASDKQMWDGEYNSKKKKLYFDMQKKQQQKNYIKSAQNVSKKRQAGAAEWSCEELRWAPRMRTRSRLGQDACTSCLILKCDQ